MPDQVEREPARLSAEWHALDCEISAERREAQAKCHEPGQSQMNLCWAGVYRDRAQKLRQAERDAAEVGRLRAAIQSGAEGEDWLNCDECGSVDHASYMTPGPDQEGMPGPWVCRRCAPANPQPPRRP